MFNREQRRAFQKKGINPDVVEFTTELVQMGAEMAAAGFGDVLPEATVVKINPETYEKHNSKRDRWIEEHIGGTFTIEYDPRWTNEPRIYCLAEDESDPKWLFTRSEFIVLQRPEKEVQTDVEQDTGEEKETVPDNG